MGPLYDVLILHVEFWINMTIFAIYVTFHLPIISRISQYFIHCSPVSLFLEANEDYYICPHPKSAAHSLFYLSISEGTLHLPRSSSITFRVISLSSFFSVLFPLAHHILSQVAAYAPMVTLPLFLPPSERTDPSRDISGYLPPQVRLSFHSIMLDRFLPFAASPSLIVWFTLLSPFLLLLLQSSARANTGKIST